MPMEYLPNGLTLEIPEGVFPLGTDSMALANFVRLSGSPRVLDLGSGAGTLGLLLCASNGGCSVTGLECDPRAQTAALENIRRNALETRLHSICADIRQIPRLFASGSFTAVVSNPPYFSGGPKSAAYPLARREELWPLEDWIAAAAWSLKFGGDFYMVYRPEGLARVISLASREGLEAKRLRLLRHREGAEVSLILLQFRRGGKPGLTWEECCLFRTDGSPTPYYRQIYHLEEA